jgi:hypothetical protein
MSNDLPPLQRMGAQSQDTVNLAAALAASMAKDTAQSAGRAAAGQLGGLSTEIEDSSRGVGAAETKISEATSWVFSKATAALRSATAHVQARATATVGAYIKEDPIKAILIAAGAGAIVMAVVAMTARAGARSITRHVQR